jgi:hypothetical protein
MRTDLPFDVKCVIALASCRKWIALQQRKAQLLERCAQQWDDDEVRNLTCTLLRGLRQRFASTYGRPHLPPALRPGTMGRL